MAAYHNRTRSLRALLATAAAAALLSPGAPATAGGQEEPAAAAESATSTASGIIVRVPLPMSGEVDTRLRQVIEEAISNLRGDPRPTLVLEFRGQKGDTGESSEFERSLSAARFLAGEQLSRVRTVAWLPQSVKGHAVLPVMACEEIVMHPDAQLGAAGVHEQHLDSVVRRGYAEIASRRRTLPEAVALGMLDPTLTVYRVKTLEGDQYLRDDELQGLQGKIASGESEAVINSVDTVFKAGEVGVLNGRQMRLTYHFASHLANDRRELAAALGMAPGSLEEDPSLGTGWRALGVDIQGPIDRRLVNRVQRGIQDERRRRRVNFVLLRLESSGGEIAEGVRLANFLAGLNPSEVRTVAYVPAQARGAAALVALACDHLLMSEAAVLGGAGAAAPEENDADGLQDPVEQLAHAKGRNWSLLLAAVDPDVTVHRYTGEESDEVRYFAAEELEQQAQPDAWRRGSEVPTAEGFTARAAEELKLARFVVAGDAELRRIYHLEKDPELLESSWAHTLIEALADPRWAAVLLFIACFALMTEAMSPGIGVPGFISALCFSLFFWSQFLQGAAGWLEVTLFLLGASCLALEIFVLPGFGVFGLGGAALVIASVVLASQTFVIPETSDELAQVPRSLGQLFLGGLGMIAALVIMRRVLPRTPAYNRLVLAPPEGDELAERENRESLVQLIHLVGKRGVTITRLVPAGKARFGDEVVNVLSRAGMVEAGADVLVAEVTGNRVIVEEVEH
jgi:membrane-bound ClpP family serine protease